MINRVKFRFEFLVEVGVTLHLHESQSHAKSFGVSPRIPNLIEIYQLRSELSIWMDGQTGRHHIPIVPSISAPCAKTT